mmetsp:Transcript_17494/g.24998  ORF Transcript_17494/g.24998 Transcript_17494/m.24998 type:complete len:376 (-) Transcript_17494:105-1232(-)
MNVPSIGIRTIHTSPQMILDITTGSPLSLNILGMIIAIIIQTHKFPKDELHRLPHDIGQHIQSSTMRHTNNKGMRTKFGSSINPILERRHDRLSSVQTKAFRGVEFMRQKVFKGVSETQAFVNVQFFLIVVLEETRIFDSFAYPVAPFGVVDVHVFHAQGAAVGGLELVEYHAECDFLFHGGEFFEVAFVSTGVCSAEVEGAVHVFVRVKAVVGGGEVGGQAVDDIASVDGTIGEGFPGVEIERVEFSGVVAVDLVGADEMGHAERVGGESGGHGSLAGVREAFARSGGRSAVLSFVVGDAFFQVFKVAAPGFGHGGLVGFPFLEHFFCVEGRGAVEEGFLFVGAEASDDVWRVALGRADDVAGTPGGQSALSTS